MSHIVLRPYQENLIVLVREALLEKKKAPLVVAATGSGKTLTFARIASEAAKRGNRVLILAHRDTLIRQASNKLRDYDVMHSIIMAGYTQNLRQLVQVASVQTLVRRVGKLPWKPNLIIVDEAHLSAAASYLKIFAHWPDAVIIGFTGSPIRLDGKPLGKISGGIYDHLIQVISISELIEQGYLVRPVVYAPAEQLDLSGIKQSMGDFDKHALAELVDKPKLIGDAVNQYRKICDGVPALAWCVTVEHAQHVADEFNANGISAVMLCGEHDTAYREEVARKSESGEIKIVTFVGIMIEGVDWPWLGAVIMMRPTMSLTSYLQVFGRALRPVYAPGFDLTTKEGRFAAIEAGPKGPVAYMIDHAGLTFRHGFVDEDREWDLESAPKSRRKKKQDEPLLDVIQCKECYAVFSPAPECPHCGAPVEKRTRSLDHADGELHEITPEMREAMRKSKHNEVKGAKSLEELERIGAQRGYSPTWAKMTFEARKRKREKYLPKRPPEPSMDELIQMSLEELEVVANQQGWPIQWPSEFFHTIGRGKAA